MYFLAVKKLESGLLKLYLVTAFAAGKPDKITEFFIKLAPELHLQSEWKEWFCMYQTLLKRVRHFDLFLQHFISFSVFPFCKNPDEHAVFAVCFTKQWQDTLLVSLHNFLATIFQCMPQPALTRLETEATLIKKLQEENNNLRSRIQSMGNQLTQPTASSSPINTSTHQSRRSTFHEQKRMADGKPHIQINTNPHTLNDVIPFYIPPPPHIVDDFYIIAQETLNVSNLADSQARSLRSLIRNISSGGSPVMGRKDSLDRGQKRSGSAGSRRSWNLH